MQDRFKFRSYYQYQDQTYKMIYDIQKMENFKEWIAQENIDPVMQCTGLRDKNDKLIYEGDILKYTALPNPFLCEWYKNGYWLNFFQNGAKRNLHSMHNSIEVIGNIYENPELLNEEEES